MPLIRLLPALLAAVGLLGQTGPVAAPAPKPMAGGPLCICPDKLPTHVGKDFGSDVYFDYDGTLYRFKEEGARLRLRSSGPSPDRLTTQASLRNGEVWEREDLDHGQGVVKVWSGDHGHLFQVDPKRGFTGYVPMFDGRLLLVQSWEPESARPHLLEIADGHRGGVTTLEDWPARVAAKHGHLSAFERGYYITLQAVPYEEYVLLYGRMSGRLQVVDAAKASLGSIDLPWSGPDDEDPSLHQAEIERRVPKCVQFIPALANTVIVVWDERSIGLDGETWAKRIESGAKREPAKLRAIAVSLRTGENRPVEVPEGAQLPLYSPDGLTLKPLAGLAGAPTR